MEYFTRAMRTMARVQMRELASAMAHEINQPLCGIRGFSENLLISIKQGLPVQTEELRHKMQRIVEQTERIVHYFEQIQTSTLVSRQTADMSRVLDAASRLIAAQLNARGIAYHIHSEPSQCPPRADNGFWVHGHPTGLVQALLSVLRNARDALPKGFRDDGQILAQLRVQGDPLRVQLEISDNGVGMSPDILERAMDPFFTTKDPLAHAGFGLTLALLEAQDAKGTLELNSSPNQGTRVIFRFPLALPPIEGTHS